VNLSLISYYNSYVWFIFRCRRIGSTRALIRVHAAYSIITHFRIVIACEQLKAVQWVDSSEEQR